jgi:cephalosporin-C deacetylase-like acetyl esterase
VSEVRAFIDEIVQPNFLTAKLGFPESVELDLDKLTTNGHSLGGITSVVTAAVDSRVKACLPMDPFFLPFAEELESLLKLSKTPVCEIVTATWFNEKGPNPKC